MLNILPNTYYTHKESAVKHLFVFLFTKFNSYTLALKSILIPVCPII